MEHWTPVFVGLGSNLDEPVRQVQAAFAALSELEQCRLLARSPLYRSAPMGPQDQPWFVNGVAGLLTLLDPQRLLDTLQTLERRFGRRRVNERWGPRILDLDLLLFGQQVIDDERLVIPHPGLTERNFVVYPLLRIAPDLRLPDGRRLADIRDQLGSDGLEEIMTADLDGDRPN
ncbi:MAG: 2-amino-4-hydroxy-6-hydroxymethyldihydropteridine diphosphokinase [Gammaproteobacteria bacterium]